MLLRTPSPILRALLALPALLLPLGCGGDAGAVGTPRGRDAGPATPAPQRYQMGGRCMGTSWSCVIEVASSGDAERVRTLVQAELDAVDAAMSTWKETSELSALNRAAAGEEVPLSEATLEVLRIADRWYRATGGAFDPSVGPLVEAWGFGAGPAEEDADGGALEAARARLGFDEVELRPGAAVKGRAEIELDLSAVAKGYGVDRAAARLAAEGFDAFFVEVGGEVVTRGRKADGTAWYVGIEDPRPPADLDPTSLAAQGQSRLPVARVSLEDGAMATSGDSRNVRRVGGRLVAHAIDPRTGEPVEHAAASVTVIAADCASADALATAGLVLGPEEGLALYGALEGVEALILAHDPAAEGGLRWLTTSGFHPYRLEKR